MWFRVVQDFPGTFPKHEFAVRAQARALPLGTGSPPERGSLTVPGPGADRALLAEHRTMAPVGRVDAVACPPWTVCVSWT
ncbi:hypothetical protein [Streptomyces sp. NPDC050546]|uniref:hypothetical protein n=1 Tax=Streptomyces sp. NPDC050546 TaxID=3365628 RepID=UPI0037AADBBE